MLLNWSVALGHAIPWLFPSPPPSCEHVILLLSSYSSQYAAAVASDSEEARDTGSSADLVFHVSGSTWPKWRCKNVVAQMPTVLVDVAVADKCHMTMGRRREQQWWQQRWPRAQEPHDLLCHHLFPIIAPLDLECHPRLLSKVNVLPHHRLIALLPTSLPVVLLLLPSSLSSVAVPG